MILGRAWSLPQPDVRKTQPTVSRARVGGSQPRRPVTFMISLRTDATKLSMIPPCQPLSGNILGLPVGVVRGDGAVGPELHEILREEQVESPVKRHAHFLLQPRQLAQVDRPPEPPGNEA